MGAAFSSVYRQITSIDLDEVFSYQTTKEVRMLDRRLGMVNWFIRGIVLVYIVVFVFWLNEGYTEIEKSVGHAITEVNGTTYSVAGTPRVWDSIDAVQPYVENGAAFISTTVYETPGQTIGPGENLQKPCSRDSDCPANPPIAEGECSNGYCLEMLWTPAYAQTDNSTQEYVLATAGSAFGIWMKSAISFPTLDDTRIFSTIGAVTPTPYADSTVTQTSDATMSTIGDGSSNPPDYYTLEELLSLAGSKIETVQASGCTLSVQFYWSCFVDGSDCYPQIQVQRLDTSEKRRGFSYQYANYYRPTAGGVDTRDLYTVYGTRILFASLGEGKKVSVSAIVLQISSMIALLWLANFAADFLMLNILPERKHYRTYKQERTPDFSDLRNKIAEVEGEKKKLRDRKNRFAAKLDET